MAPSRSRFALLQNHILKAEKLGIGADKLNLLVVWHRAPQFSKRERAALASAEALTKLGGGVSDEVYAEACAEFSEKERIYLTCAIGVINMWNRYGWPITRRRRRGQTASVHGS